MDEAELARQMEKAELENAEIGGNPITRNVYTTKNDSIPNFSQQVTMINLIWKQRELEQTKLGVGKKAEKKVKQKRRNKDNALLFFYRYLKISARRRQSAPITQPQENICVLVT